MTGVQIVAMTNQLKGLYAITTPQLDRGSTQNHLLTLLASVKLALEGGTSIVQYRDKHSSAKVKIKVASALATLCQQFNAVLIINDDLSIATELGVGLHLGREDGSIEAARKILGEKAIIGATCHDSLQFAEEAAQQGASYLAFGRFFPSTTKPHAPQAPLDILTIAKARFQLPLVAIGGINLDNAKQAINAGANMIAAADAIFNAPNITKTCQQFQALISSTV